MATSGSRLDRSCIVTASGLALPLLALSRGLVLCSAAHGVSCRLRRIVRVMETEQSHTEPSSSTRII